MKIFTKSVMVAIALMAGVTTASAQEEDWMDPETWEEVVPEMWGEYTSSDGTHWDATSTYLAEISPAWNTNSETGQGQCIIGAENVNQNLYADLTDYKKIILMGSCTGAPTRFMCNRKIVEGAWKNLNIQFDETDSHWNADMECLVIDLDEIKTLPCTANGEGDSEGVKTGDERTDDFVHFHCIKNGWFGDNKVTLTAAYLWPAKNAAGIKSVNVKSAKGMGKIYNLNGVEVKNPTKGLYIQNGKKVIL